MQQQATYIHTPEVHNLMAPREVVPYLVEIFKPESALDVGCGTGTWLKIFYDKGVKDIKGLDGDFVNMDLLRQNISVEQFHAADLREPFDLERKFDLVISLEVAEHLPQATADQFVESLTRHADTIVFSAALPGQGGQNHLNEQWKKYWIDKFASFHFTVYDILRARFWNNKNVDWWYKQNMLVFSKKDLTSLLPSSSLILEAIHPDLLQQNLNYIIYLQEYINQLETKLYELDKLKAPLKGMN
jgi:SAM-dependent methyltransferase